MNDINVFLKCYPMCGRKPFEGYIEFITKMLCWDKD